MQKDRLIKFSNAENSNNPNQDKIVVELKGKLKLSKMRQKEKAILTELKKANKITKENLAECQQKQLN